MLKYREYLPPPQLADTAECCWSLTNRGASAVVQRVLPDGCADILFVRSAKTSMIVVGAMTRFEDFETHPLDLLIGIRFRPGRWKSVFGVPGTELTDNTPALEDVWGARARRLQERMSNTRTGEDAVAILAASVPSIKRNKQRWPIFPIGRGLSR